MREDLIFDVGLHDGDDTDFYLHKGYSVVGIEANPALVASARIRFRDAIAQGRLTLIEGAIGPASSGAKIAFYANTNQSLWGTVEANWAIQRGVLGFPSERIEVDRVDIVDIFRSYGVPFYLKVDIEGLDRFVLEELTGFRDRPRYVSLESDRFDFDQLKAEMDLFKNLSYTKFKIVQQETIPGRKISTHTREGEPLEYEFGHHSSGAFGNDLPGPWLIYDEALQCHRSIFRGYKYFGDDSYLREGPKTAQRIIRKLYRMCTGYKGPLMGWFDTHASL
jgi:FkbM family methyltransferase